MSTRSKTKKRSKHYQEVFSPKSMRLAWERYIRSGQKEAKDYLGIRAFKANLDYNLAALSDLIMRGEYFPCRPPKFFVPKANGMQRTITMLPVVDALVFQAFANWVANRVYRHMAENDDFVFGSVLHEEVAEGMDLLDYPEAQYYFFRSYLELYKQFADSVDNAILNDKVKYRFETDITGFYDNIPHYNLLDTIERKSGATQDILDLIGEGLNIWSGTREGPTPGVGIPQGADASHFFANLFLHDLDNLIKLQGLPYYRYMDDIRIYGYNEDELRDVLILIDRYLKRHALALNAKKTSVESITEETVKQSVIVFAGYQGVLAPESVVLPVIAARNDPSLSPKELKLDTLVITEGLGGLEAVAIDGQGTPHEIIEIAKRDLKEDAGKVAELANKKKVAKIDFNDRAIQREYYASSFRFRQAIHILKTHSVTLDIPEEDTINGWLFLADRLYWKMSHFLWALSLYNDNERVKTGLISLSGKYGHYEWIFNQVHMCLAVSQTFTTKELRELFRDLGRHESWYTRKSLYFLLLRHCDNRQLFKSIIERAKTETEGELRRCILFLKGEWLNGSIRRQDILEAFGVT